MPGWTFAVLEQKTPHSAGSALRLPLARPSPVWRLAAGWLDTCMPTLSMRASWTDLTAKAAPSLVTRGAASLLLSLSCLALHACEASSRTTLAGPTPARCEVAATTDPNSFGAAGGSGSLAITTQRECDWNATTAASWIVLPPARSGQGPGSLTYSVSENRAPSPRSGAIVINDASVEVQQQAAACAFRVEPLSAEASAESDEIEVSIETLEGCSWEARSSVPWISFTSNSAGSGPGPLRFRVASNDGPERTGEVLVADQRIAVRQAAAAPAPPPLPPAPACTFSLSPRSLAVGSEGGTVTLAVATAAGCSWTAESSADWLVIAAGRSGTGAGSLRIDAAPNSATSERTATITVAGVQAIVRQAGQVQCVYDVQPRTANVAHSGGVVNVQVITETGCSWTAESQASWLSISVGATGTGPGAVQVQAAATTSASSRSGTVTVAGLTVTINQPGAPAPCSYQVEPLTISFPPGGGASTVSVATQAGCSWTAAGGDAWLRVTAGATGSGNGSVQLTADANPAPNPRSTTALIAGTSVAVEQAAAPLPCTYDVEPVSVIVSPAGETVEISVSARAECAWRAETSTPWLSITSGQEGSGEGTVTVVASPNLTSSERNGSVLVAGRSVSFRQGGADLRPFSGRIRNLSGSCPALSFTVDDEQIRTTAETSFSPACSAFRANDRVAGEGVMQGELLYAVSIRRLN